MCNVIQYSHQNLEAARMSKYKVAVFGRNDQCLYEVDTMVNRVIYLVNQLQEVGKDASLYVSLRQYGRPKRNQK